MNIKRQQIIDAAHQLFIKKGFALTSIQDILNQAGVAKGTFYNYFTSKNECLIAILEAVTDEVDQKRREIALGKDTNNEEIFIQQLAVRMNMNKQHRILTMFESVSFSDDQELKAYMKKQYLTELHWIKNRLSELYPKEAKAFLLDHSVMLMGIIHHMLHIWMLGSTKEISTEAIIRYALRRIKSMLHDQIKQDEILLYENFLSFLDHEESPDLNWVLSQLRRYEKEIEDKNSKQMALIQFLIAELEKEEPRLFLVESVSMSLEHAFEQSNLEHEVRHLARIVKKCLNP